MLCKPCKFQSWSLSPKNYYVVRTLFFLLSSYKWRQKRCCFIPRVPSNYRLLGKPFTLHVKNIWSFDGFRGCFAHVFELLMKFYETLERGEEWKCQFNHYLKCEFEIYSKNLIFFHFLWFFFKIFLSPRTFFF